MSVAISGAIRGITRMSPRSYGRPAGRLCGARRPEQFFDIREGASQFFENRDCRILQSTFETADIGPVDPGIDGKRFLAEAALQPKPPDISRDNPAQ
jgi:hypothetical protein